MFYLCLAEKIGFPLSGVALPGHFFVRHQSGAPRTEVRGTGSIFGEHLAEAHPPLIPPAGKSLHGGYPKTHSSTDLNPWLSAKAGKNKANNIETTNKGCYFDNKYYAKKYALSRKIPFYLKNLSKKETLGVYLKHIGNIYMEKGLSEAAIAAYQQAILLAPGYPDTYIDLGKAQLIKGQYAQAETFYQKALEIDPGSAAANYMFGYLYYQKGMFPEAIAAYKKALETDPGLVEAYVNLGVTYEEEGKNDLAAKAYRKALALNPRLTETHFNLGNVYQKKGLVDEAVQSYRQALALKPDYPEAHFNLGEAYQKKGRFQEAEAEFQRAKSNGEPTK